MKWIVTTDMTPEEKKIYPWLGVQKDSGAVVLFTEPRKGTVVGHTGFQSRASATPQRVGYTTTAWIENTFNKFEGEVTLSND